MNMLPRTFGNCTLGLVLALVLLCASFTHAAPVPTTAVMDVTTDNAQDSTDEPATELQLHNADGSLAADSYSVDHLFADPPGSSESRVIVSQDDMNGIILNELAFAEAPTDEDDELGSGDEEEGGEEGDEDEEEGGEEGDEEERVSPGAARVDETPAAAKSKGRAKSDPEASA